MKTKVWLTRTGSLIGYKLWASKPSDFSNFFPGGKKNEGYFRKGKFLIAHLCPKLSKKCFGLKKHLNPNNKQILEGTMEFKFKEK